MLTCRALPIALAAAFAVACSFDPGGPGGDDDQGDSPGDSDAGGVTALCDGIGPAPAQPNRTIQSGGMTRTYFLHVPPSYDPAVPMPVVLSFHGYSSNAGEQNVLAAMNAKADSAGFITVHAEGTGSPQSWNAGVCCGSAARNQVQDIQLVEDILDDVEATVCVDTARVFSTGMSNGGFLSHRLACELSDRIAAIAPVAGVIGVDSCTPPRPVPVMHFHGTSDTLVPYNGNLLQGWPSVPETVAGWAKRNGCSAAKETSFLNGDSHCESFTGCPDDGDVTLCTVELGGHTWPGGYPVPSLGKTTMALSATDTMWAFFAAHPMPQN